MATIGAGDLTMDTEIRLLDTDIGTVVGASTEMGTDMDTEMGTGMDMETGMVTMDISMDTMDISMVLLDMDISMVVMVMGTRIAMLAISSEEDIG